MDTNIYPPVKRNVLLNPGPSTTRDSVKYSLVMPDLCPREKSFSKVMKDLTENLVKIVHGDLKDYATVLFSGSGSICIDAAISSFLDKNKKVLILTNGKFSERAIEVCDYYKMPYDAEYFPYDKPVDPKIVEEKIKKEIEKNKENPYGIIYVTHQETGAGLLNPIRELGKLAHKFGSYFVTDTVSTYAMIPINIIDDNIDALMASAQKGIMAMTGLSFVIANRKLIENSKNFPKRSYYTNIYRQYEYFERTGQMNFTAPVQLIYAATQAVKEYFQEGEENKWNRHKRTIEAIYKGQEELGFKYFVDKKYHSGLVSVVIFPDDENWDYDKIHDYVYERGFTLYLGNTKEIKTLRLSSLGAIDVPDIENFWKVFKEALKKYNVSVPLKYKNNK